MSLGDLLGPEFEANPRELFGPDNYHPSAEGYATAAMAVLPTVCAALGLWPAEEERPDVSRREGFLPVARAAAAAVSEPGTEVTAAMPTGPRGPWALLKRRRRRRVPATDPAPTPGECRAADPGEGVPEGESPEPALRDMSRRAGPWRQGRTPLAGAGIGAGWWQVQVHTR